MQVKKVGGARPDEVLFISGATESNNMPILGLIEAGCCKWAYDHENIAGTLRWLEGK